MSDNFPPQSSLPKNKIINDPLYGFLNIPGPLIFELIEHPYFQRLRNIKQLGLSYLVFPGAVHTRFHHALGALKLMTDAMETLKRKNADITPEEEEAVYAAILLHDIGHGPFSHALEKSIVPGLHHEDVSAAYMEDLNAYFDGKLTLAIAIFNDTYPKKFLHQLVSGQLDMDRMDYLMRDSFYTGVSEGVISYDRIIKMLNVKDDQLVVEEKGIYSIEKFLIARRLMYWQVYLHKTVVAAEQLVVQLLRRAKHIAQKQKIFSTPSFGYFLYNEVSREDFLSSPDIRKKFALLDDNDIMSGAKGWLDCDDIVLRTLSEGVYYRKLPKIVIQKEPISTAVEKAHLQHVKDKLHIGDEEAAYLVTKGEIGNIAYDDTGYGIQILRKQGQLTDIAEASDNYNIYTLRQEVVKYYLSYFK